jgi:23S rRNA pseudouridine2605 synthase
LEKEVRVVLERVQKVLAAAGVASRREAEQWIAEGRVMVNGQVVDSMGFKVDPDKDFIKVDGKRVHRPEQKLTLLLHKPRNVVCTVKDPQERTTVMDLVANVKSRVYPVGRLDFDAEGLLVMTNDGDLANLLTHPRYGVPRTYLAKVSGIPDTVKLERLKNGVILEDGRARAVQAEILRPGDKNTWVKIVVTEGRNHLVKKMLQAVGHPVSKLKRIEFGPFQLGRLPAGQVRIVSQEEVEQIKEKLSQAKPKTEESSDRPALRPPKREGRSSRPWVAPQEGGGQGEGGEIKREKRQPWAGKGGPSDRPDRRPPKREGRSEGPWAPPRQEGGGQVKRKPRQTGPGKKGPSNRPSGRPGRKERAERKKR